jgi:hypothetical protein
MKNILLIFTLFFSAEFFSSPSYAKLMKVDESVDGDIFYKDFDRIKKHCGYVYYWNFQDNLKSTKSGTLSFKVYNQGDCKLFQIKVLCFSFHKEQMGGGTGEMDSNVSDKEWDYPTPNLLMEIILKFVNSSRV